MPVTSPAAGRSRATVAPADDRPASCRPSSRCLWPWPLALLGITGGLLCAEPQTKPEYDAAFVKMIVPDKVASHGVFPVTIAVRNTGPRTWEGPAVRLRSISPPNNRVWGTDYILVAQGTAVKSGQEYAFRSHLKAPADLGTMKFQWQVCKDGEKWFGEVTPAKTIEVVAGPTTARKTSVPAHKAHDGKKVLAFEDFAYLGSFKPPKVVSDARGAFSESGLALRPMPGGRDRLFVNYTHPGQVLFEIEISVRSLTPARARPPCLSPPCCTILRTLPPRATATISTPTAASGVINLLDRSGASGPTTTGAARECSSRPKPGRPTWPSCVWARAGWDTTSGPSPAPVQRSTGTATTPRTLAQRLAAGSLRGRSPSAR